VQQAAGIGPLIFLTSVNFFNKFNSFQDLLNLKNDLILGHCVCLSAAHQKQKPWFCLACTVIV
jgi:hypothetical protein